MKFTERRHRDNVCGGKLVQARLAGSWWTSYDIVFALISSTSHQQHLRLRKPRCFPSRWLHCHHSSTVWAFVHNQSQFDR